MTFSIVLTVILGIGMLGCFFMWNSYGEWRDEYHSDNRQKREIWSNRLLVSIIWFVAQLLITVNYYT